MCYCFFSPVAGACACPDGAAFFFEVNCFSHLAFLASSVPALSRHAAFFSSMVIFLAAGFLSMVLSSVFLSVAAGAGAGAGAEVWATANPVVLKMKAMLTNSAVIFLIGSHLLSRSVDHSCQQSLCRTTLQDRKSVV